MNETTLPVPPGEHAFLVGWLRAVLDTNGQVTVADWNRAIEAVS